MQLNKAHVIDRLSMELGRRCPTNADVGKWVAYAVSRCVRKLIFKLRWSADPTSLPTSLYSSQSLVELTLSHKILVDVPSSASLPSLKSLALHFVVYKDDDSVVSLLSSCPVLERLDVERDSDMDDNVSTFSVKVPSLLYLEYIKYDTDFSGCLVIDTPVLSCLSIYDYSGGSCSMELPSLDSATINLAYCPDPKFLTSLSSVRFLTLCLNDETVSLSLFLSLSLLPIISLLNLAIYQVNLLCSLQLVCCTSIKFPWLIHCTIYPTDSGCWREPVMLLLQNSPKMKSLTISYVRILLLVSSMLNR